MAAVRTVPLCAWGLLVLAAGRGRRLGSPALPKPFLPLAGRPALLWALDAFATLGSTAETLVIVPPGRAAALWRRFGATLRRAGVRALVAGGRRRQDSVRRGLEALDARIDRVLIHDGARPCVTPDEIAALMAALPASGARRADGDGAVLISALTDTVKRLGSRGRIVGTEDRRTLGRALTPQAFRRAALEAALAAAGRRTVTDEAQALEALGRRVRAVPGAATNIKITVPADWALAEAILRAR